jgi:hypothetical protein
MQPYGGSAWWLLNRETASAVLRFLDSNRWFLNAFRWSSVPDEMFFQTIIANLGIRPDRTTRTFANWTKGASHPLAVSETTLQEAKASWHLMARKFEAVFD